MLSVAAIFVATPSQAYTPPGTNTLASRSIVTKAPSATGGTGYADLSDDGRFVAFDSTATDLVRGDTNLVNDVFEFDRVSKATTRVSVASDGSQGLSASKDVSPNNLPKGSFEPAISSSGRYVAFNSDDVNLVPGDTNLVSDIFVHDRVTGTTERVSVGAGGMQANNASGPRIGISGDGRYVIFVSDATNLVAGDTNGAKDLFVHDRRTGATTRVTDNASGVGGGRVAISADGRYVAFPMSPSTASQPSTGQTQQVWIRDLKTGKLARGDLDSHGQATATPLIGGSFVMNHGLSADGRYLLFSSVDAYVPAKTTMSNVAGAPGYEVYRRDLRTGITERVTITSAGEERDGGTLGDAALSSNGRFVSYATFQDFGATTRVPCGLCAGEIVWVHDCLTGQTDVATMTADGQRAAPQSGQAADGPTISANGRYLAFTSNIPGLASGDKGAFTQWQTYVRDRGDPQGATLTSPTATVSVLGVGGDITGASVAWRPAGADLAVRIDLRSPPSAAGAVTYGLRFSSGRHDYDVRIARASAAPTFELFVKTATGWSRLASLRGGYGTVSDAVVAAVPQQLLGGQRVDLRDLWTYETAATTSLFATTVDRRRLTGS